MSKLLSYFVIPCITLIFSMQASLTQENFTRIANNNHHHLSLFLWSLISSIYFYWISKKIFDQYHYHTKTRHILEKIILIFAIVNPLIPYNETYIHLASLHTLLSFLASTLFFYIHFLFLFFIQSKDYHLFLVYKQKLLFILSTISLLILLFGKINSLIEVLNVIFMCLYLESLKNY